MVHRKHLHNYVFKVHAYLGSISIDLFVALFRFPPSFVAFVTFHLTFMKILASALCTNGRLGRKFFRWPASQPHSPEFVHEKLTDRGN